MTISTRIVKAIVTLPILGTVSRDERGEVVKKGESYRIHIYAAKPGWKENKSLRDMLFVGSLEGQGYTTSPYKRSVEVALPSDRELVALRFDEDFGLSWDEFPIHIDLWFNGEGWMTVEDEQVFINDASIQPGAIQSHSITIGVKTAKTTADKLREIVSKYLTGEASEYEDELVDELKAFVEKESDSTRLAVMISEQIRQRLKREMQPGGLLHKR